MVNPVTSSSGSNISSPYSGLMRVNGLASGMDIDGIVSKLMKAEAIPLDKLKQKQQLLQWQRDDYRDTYTTLQDLDSTIFNGIGRQSTFNKKTVTSSNDSLVSATAVTAINNTYAQIGVSNLATANTWTSSPTTYQPPSTTKTLQFTVTDPGSSTPRSVSISISSTDTISNVIDKFNSSSLGVTMFQNTSNNTLVVSNNNTGTGGSIQVTNADADTISFMTNTLGFTLDGSNALTDNNASSKAQDASITFNGAQMTEKSNTFNIGGVNYTIKGTTSSVSVSTATDVDSIYNSIKDFVDKYNDAIKKINDKISEKRNRDYQPLTDDQRAAMSETQITQWEAKAKTGMLSNDSILSSGLNKMREDLYSPVSGTNVTTGFTQLSQIGITTSKVWQDNGKLVIDETKLRQQIQANPQAIYQLFNTGVSSTDTINKSSYTYNTEGIAKRLRDSIAATLNQIITRAGKTTYMDTQYDLGKQLTDLSTQITKFQSRLADKENQYYSQFSAMEKAMEQANQQASYFSQQFSG